MVVGKVSKVKLTYAEILQEISKVNVLTERVRKRKNEYLAAVPHICSDRARLITESWKETDGEPIDIRSAKIFKTMVEGIGIAIHEGELIVGSQTKYVRGAHPNINWDPYTTIEICESSRPTTSSEVVFAELAEVDRQSLLRDATYWKGKSGRDAYIRALRFRYHDGVSDYDLDSDCKAARLCIGLDEYARDEGFLDHAMVLSKGYKGIIAKARDEFEHLNYSLEPAAAYRKACFMQAVIIVLETGIRFAERYAELAKELATSEKDMCRRRELEKIAEICQWVPANPARTFCEALQSTWFAHLGLVLELALQAESLGRMDQYLFSYYERDLREGRLTRQEAAELLGCFWVKASEIDCARGIRHRENSVGTQYQDVTISGVTPDGRDATNELSFLILEVTRQVRMAQPAVYLRYHNHISSEVLIKAAEVNRDYGAGMPAFMNDGAVVPHLISRGVSTTDARNWAVGGCSVPALPCCNGAALPFASFNLAKILELTLNNGIDPYTGKRLGVATGDPRQFTSFSELVDAFKKQVDAIVKVQCEIWRVKLEAPHEVYRLPFNSAVCPDAITKGMDVLVGGVRYPQLMPLLVVRQWVDVADSLAAIKKLVLEEKRLTMGELLEALAVNFDGKENIRRMLLAAPKYGNDNDYVDEIFNDLQPWTANRVTQEKVQGFSTSITSVGAAMHYYFGKTVGALPNGRKAGEPLNDGGLSPMRGMDTRGPTAVINSAGKIPRADLMYGTLLNMKLDPSLLRTPEGIAKFLALTKTYFDKGGGHIQFNMLDRRDLEEAQKHPERFRDLLVRVAGYSAYFVELPKGIQDEIIARTEHTF